MKAAGVLSALLLFWLTAWLLLCSACSASSVTAPTAPAPTFPDRPAVCASALAVLHPTECGPIYQPQ